METNFNIKKTNPSSRKYFEKQKFSLKQFDKDLTMMTRKHENYINLLAELPAGEAIKKMIEERSLNFLVDIEGLGLSEKLEGGFLRINKEDGTVEVFNEEKSVKVLFKDSPLKVKDLAQPLVDEKDPEKNSNVVNSFYSYLEKKAYGFCLGRVVSRWKVETKMS